MLVNLGMTLFWEYVIEFKEIISLNDIIINDSAGLAIGEPLLQLGALARASSGAGWTGVGALAAPFDAAHGFLDGPGPARVPPWHRLELSAGAGRWASSGEHWMEGTLGLDVSIVAVPGFARPGSRSRRVALGGWNRITGRLTLGDGEPDAPTVAARFLTRTSLVGHIWRDVADGQDGLVGSETLLALGTGFTYDARRIVGERDHVAIAHLAGGQVAIVSYRGAPDLRAGGGPAQSVRLSPVARGTWTWHRSSSAVGPWTSRAPLPAATSGGSSRARIAARPSFSARCASSASSSAASARFTSSGRAPRSSAPLASTSHIPTISWPARPVARWRGRGSPS